MVRSFSGSSRRKRRISGFGKRTLVSADFWRPIASRFRSSNRRVHPQKPSRPHHSWINRSVPVDGSHYFEVSYVGEKMSTLGAGNVKMGSLDIRRQRSRTGRPFTAADWRIVRK
jgi:hypothetical protein